MTVCQFENAEKIMKCCSRTSMIATRTAASAATKTTTKQKLAVDNSDSDSDDADSDDVDSENLKLMRTSEVHF
jgi:hypothetical protein